MTPRTHGTSDDRSRQRTDTATHAGAPATDLTRRLIENLHHQQAKVPANATRNDWYMALAHTVRERVLDRYIATLDAIAGATVEPQGGRLPLGRIPGRSASREQSGLPRAA